MYAGLDLSARTDLTALVLIGQDDDGVWHAQPFFWPPEAGLQDHAHRDSAPYDVWACQGLLRTTPGAAIDYEVIARDMAEILSDLDIQAVAFDRWRIDVLKKELDRLGMDLPLVPFGQGFKDMGPPSMPLEVALLDRQVARGGNPVLTMCAANATTMKDPAGNRKLDKSRTTGRIDGIVALAMAFGIAAQHEQTGVINAKEIFFV